MCVVRIIIYIYIYVCVCVCVWYDNDDDDDDDNDSYLRTFYSLATCPRTYLSTQQNQPRFDFIHFSIFILNSSQLSNILSSRGFRVNGSVLSLSK
jgi:hypothetical protein